MEIKKSVSARFATYGLRPQDVGASTLPREVAILVDDPLIEIKETQ